MARNVIVDVDVCRGKYVSPVFKSYTKPGALRELSNLYTGLYIHDLDTDRAQVSETLYTMRTYNSKGVVQETVTFSNRELIDNGNVYTSLMDIINARRA